MISGSVCLGVLLDFHAMLGAPGYLLVRPDLLSLVFIFNAVRQLPGKRRFTAQQAARYYTAQRSQLKAQDWFQGRIPAGWSLLTDF